MDKDKGKYKKQSKRPLAPIASTRQTLKMDKDKGKYKKQSKKPLAPIAEMVLEAEHRKKESFKSSYEFSIRDCTEAD